MQSPVLDPLSRHRGRIRPVGNRGDHTIERLLPHFFSTACGNPACVAAGDAQRQRSVLCHRCQRGSELANRQWLLRAATLHIRRPAQLPLGAQKRRDI